MTSKIIEVSSCKECPFNCIDGSDDKASCEKLLRRNLMENENDESNCLRVCHRCGEQHVEFAMSGVICRMCEYKIAMLSL